MSSLTAIDPIINSAVSQTLLTVGILTRNSSQTLPETLRSLDEQTCPRDFWRLLIIDHESTDETLALASDFVSNRENAQIISRHENHLARSRQFILDSSQSEWVCFVDSDVVLPVDWLEKSVRLIRAGKAAHCAGFAGPLRMKPIHRRLGLLESLQSTSFGHLYTGQMWIPSAPQMVSHLPTAAAVFRRESLLQIGGFDLAFARTGEDLDLGERLSSLGMKLCVLPELEVIHRLSCRGWRGWLTRAFRFGDARIRVARGLPRLFLRPQTFLPLLFIGAQAAILLELAICIRVGAKHGIILGVLALAAWPLAVFLGVNHALGSGTSRAVFPATSLALLTQLAYATGELFGIFRLAGEIVARLFRSGRVREY